MAAAMAARARAYMSSRTAGSSRRIMPSVAPKAMWKGFAVSIRVHVVPDSGGRATPRL
jgi:hypothetical protein